MPILYRYLGMIRYVYTVQIFWQVMPVLYIYILTCYVYIVHIFDNKINHGYQKLQIISKIILTIHEYLQNDGSFQQLHQLMNIHLDS